VLVVLGYGPRRSWRETDGHEIQTVSQFFQDYNVYEEA
jgi:hypothetical protein